MIECSDVKPTTITESSNSVDKLCAAAALADQAANPVRRRDTRCGWWVNRLLKTIEQSIDVLLDQPVLDVTHPYASEEEVEAQLTLQREVVVYRLERDSAMLLGNVTRREVLEMFTSFSVHRAAAATAASNENVANDSNAPDSQLSIKHPSARL